MNAKPVLDRVIIKQDEAQDKIGNFTLSETAKERPKKGVVVAVGPGAISALGKTIPMMTVVGDKVMYDVFSGQNVQIEGEEYVVVKEGELLLVL